MSRTAVLTCGFIVILAAWAQFGPPFLPSTELAQFAQFILMGTLSLQFYIWIDEY